MCNALLGSKAMQASAGVKQMTNCLDMPLAKVANLVGRTPEQTIISGIKGHAGVSKGSHCYGYKVNDLYVA